MRIVIFRPGTWNGTRYTKEFCRAMAEAYDPTGGIEAPLVVGHRSWSEAPRDEDELAHGWAQRLEVDGSGKVFAVVPNPSPEMVGWIQTNRLRYLSVEMSYDLNERGEPTNPQLIRMCALGRSIPAVPTTRIRAEFDRTGDVLTIHTTDDGTFVLARLSASFDAAEHTNTPQEEDGMDTDTGTGAPTAALDEHARAQLEQLRRRNEELERRERERESAAFVATVGGTGLAPAVRELAAALDAKLGEADRAQYRELLGKLAPPVTLGRETTIKQAQGPEGSLASQVRAYQRTHKIETFEAALDGLRAESPELFGGAA